MKELRFLTNSTAVTSSSESGESYVDFLESERQLLLHMERY